MGNKYIYILCFILLGCIQSCAPSKLGPDDFISFCNDKDHGLIQTRPFNAVLYSLKYEPIEYKAIMDLKNSNIPVSRLNFEKTVKEYEGLYYFTFKMEHTGSDKSPIKSIIQSEADLAKVNQYCQSALTNDFYLESGTDKIPCVLFHLEDDYHISNYNIMSLAFEKDKVDMTQDIVFVFNDPFFKSGTLKFNISKESITQLPTLKLL